MSSMDQVTTIELTHPILLELDEDSWSRFLDRTESWCGNLLMVQRKFRAQVEDTSNKVREPHIKTYLRTMAETATQHEQDIEDLYRVIGRTPSSARKLAGAVLSKGSAILADVEGFVGGAVGGLKDLRILLIANIDSMGAFATAEQFGLSLGISEIVDITFPIVHQKSTDHLLLQEYMLARASLAILYESPMGEGRDRDAVTSDRRP